MPLTRITITIIYGDNIPDAPMANSGQDQWPGHGEAVGRGHEPAWRQCDGGAFARAGHTRQYPLRFSDLNNLEIADLLSTFLEKNGLD